MKRNMMENVTRNQQSNKSYYDDMMKPVGLLNTPMKLKCGMVCIMEDINLDEFLLLKNCWEINYRSRNKMSVVGIIGTQWCGQVSGFAEICLMQ